jgi:WD40 repeat protein
MGNNLHLLKGNMGGISSINFTSDGELMAMAESADFVHIFDTKQHYENAQVIDFFGEVSGLSFSPDTQSLFIGVEPEQDMIGSTLLWYDKCRNLERYNYV